MTKLSTSSDGVYFDDNNAGLVVGVMGVEGGAGGADTFSVFLSPASLSSCGSTAALATAANGLVPPAPSKGIILVSDLDDFVIIVTTVSASVSPSPSVAAGGLRGSFVIGVLGS